MSLQSSSADGAPSSFGGWMARFPGIYGLLLLQIGVSLIDHGLQNPFVKRNLYLWHGATHRFQPWQLLTASFCHMDRIHLGTNLFLLLIMGRSVEAEFGTKGLLASFAICSIISSMVSLCLLPGKTISIGASGGILGLFLISALNQVWHCLQSNKILSNWRTLLEVLVMGEFVIRQFIAEVSTSAVGGKRAINLVGHLAGAFVAAVASRWVLTHGLHSTMRWPDFGGPVIVPEIVPMKMPRKSKIDGNLATGPSWNGVPWANGMRTRGSSNGNTAPAGRWSEGPWSNGLRQSNEKRPRAHGQRFSNEDAWSQGQRKFGGDDKEVYRNRHPNMNASFSQVPSGNTKVNINGVEVAASVSPDGRINYGMDTDIHIEPEKHWWHADVGGDYEDLV